MIETLDDWNERLACVGCCLMPDCGILVLVSQHARYKAVTAGFTDESPPDPVFDLGTWMRYAVKTRTRTGEFSEISEYDGFSPPYHYTEDRTSEYNWITTQTYNSLMGETGTCASGTVAITTITLSTECTGDGFYTFIFTVENAARTVIKAKSELYLTAVPATPSASGSTCRYDITSVEINFDDTTIPPTPSTTTTTTFVDSDPRLYGEGYDTTTDTSDYADGINWADWLSNAVASGTGYLGSIGDACWINSEIPAKTDLDIPTTKSDNGELILDRVRYRWRIPNTHTGTYYKITWDIAEIPDDGDPSFFSEDIVYEWEGPGEGEESDPSWLSPWYYVDPPSVPGIRKIVNIRYTCYHGTKFGVKPQIIGESFTPP